MTSSNTFLSKSVLWRLPLLLFTAAIPNCYALDPHRAISQYVLDRWGPEQGLPRGSVYAIAQTLDGYLWIGSQAGLIRFDGLQFNLIRDESGALSFRSVVGLVADTDGSLWIRLHDMTLIRYRNGKFESPRPDYEFSDVSAMVRTSLGTLLAARMQMGAFSYRDNSLRLIARATGLPRSPVLAVAQTGAGDFWLGTRGSGLFRLSGGQTVPVSRGLPDPKVNCLLPDRDSVWIGTDAGVVRWNGSELTSDALPRALRQSQILALAKDRDANLWVGNDAGQLMRLNGEGLASVERDQSEPQKAITVIFEGRDGSLWIGSDSSLQRLRDSPFVTYSDPEGLPTNGSNPVFVDSENRTWFGPVAGGLEWFRGEHRELVRAEGLDHDIVYSISGTASELWIGRQRGGLTRLRAGRAHIEAKTWRESDGLAQNSVFSVYRARDGVVWAGTLSGGVSRFDGGKFTGYTMRDGLASNTVSAIAQGADQTMWFATPGGLSSLRGGKWQTFRADDGLPSGSVNCLLEDRGGVLWAGTTAGLAFRGPRMMTVPVALPSNLKEEIMGLAQDDYGSLWVATAHHVMRVNRDKLLRGVLTPADVREFGLIDGLRGVEGVKRNQSVVADSLGRIWFSLNRGISVVEPSRLSVSSAPALPHVQTLLADGASVALDEAIWIPPRPQRIVFGYTGLSLSTPERVRYRYFLEGSDVKWCEPTAEMSASYTNLGPGPYRFRVLATNPDGVWSTREGVLAFRVSPAYWQTWWFRTGAVALSGLAAIVLYRLRLRQMSAVMTMRFEERLAERTRIAQELHDTLLQGF